MGNSVPIISSFDTYQVPIHHEELASSFIKIQLFKKSIALRDRINASVAACRDPCNALPNMKRVEGGR